MKWLSWMTASLALTYSSTSIAQATTIYIGLTYCPPPGTAPSPQPTLGVWAPYYLFVAASPSSSLQYLNDNGTLTSDVTKAAQFVFTNEGRLRSGKKYVSTNSTTSLQVFKTSPYNQSISTSFLPEDGYLRWRNNAFSGREAQFCRRNNTILVSFQGLQFANCQPVSVGVVLVSSFFKQSQSPTTTGVISTSGKLTATPSTSLSSSATLRSTSSTITTSTTATAPYPWPSSSGAPNCVGRSIYDGTVNDGFLILCATSIEGVELTTRNLLSFKACIESCRSYNNTSNEPCVAIEYLPSSIIGNCRLLRSIRPISKGSNSSTDAAIVVDQPYAPALLFLTEGNTTEQLSSTSSIATKATTSSSTTRSSTTGLASVTSSSTLTNSTVTVTSSASTSLLASDSSGSNTSSYTTVSDRTTSSSISAMTSISATTRSTSAISSQSPTRTSSIESTSTSISTAESTSSRATLNSATTITMTSILTSPTTISSTSDAGTTTTPSLTGVSSTVLSSMVATTSVETSSAASTSVTASFSSTSPTIPTSFSISTTSESASVTSRGTTTSTVSGDAASTSELSTTTASAAATTSSSSESPTTTLNVSGTGPGVSTTTTEFVTTIVSSSTSEITTSTDLSTTTLSSISTSTFTTTVTTTLASTSCPVLPASSPLCPQRNRTKIAFSNDNICYGILCSTTLQGTIITANSSVVNNLRACAGRCALYNTAIPYGCLGVNYLSTTATSDAINCLLFSKVTAQVEDNTGGVDSIRLVYAGYSNVQKREELYTDEDWEWPDDLVVEE